MSRNPEGVEADFALARLTTIRIGGPADYFARPESEARLVELLAWAAAESCAVAVIGSGSNLLVSDLGFRGLVLKLDGELTRIEREGRNVLCGGGARLPSVSARAADWGLAGIEFGVNIPGTVGGAVRMNANAYGGELAAVLAQVHVCGPEGAVTRLPDELGFGYRSSSIADGEVVTEVSFALAPEDPAVVRARMGEMRSRRHEAQPSGIKTFGSTFVNPTDPRAKGRSAGELLDAAGCLGMRRGAARFSEKHANFVENLGGAEAAEVLAVMAAGRAAVHARFGVTLEPEVQILGEFEWPPEWRVE